jgi:hypothetical protein
MHEFVSCSRNTSGILVVLPVLCCGNFLVEYSTWSTTTSGIHTPPSGGQYHGVWSKWGGIPILPHEKIPPRWNFGNNTIDEWCHYHSTQNDKSIHSRGRPIFSPTVVQPEQIKRDYFQDECDPHETSYWKRCGETLSHEEFLKGKEKRSTYPPHVGITRCAQRRKGIQQPTAVTPCHFIVSFMWSIMTFKLEVQCVFFLWPQMDVMLFPEKWDRKETANQSRVMIGMDRPKLDICQCFMWRRQNDWMFQHLVDRVSDNNDEFDTCCHYRQ